MNVCNPGRSLVLLIAFASSLTPFARTQEPAWQPKATWIAATPDGQPSQPGPLPLFRRAFTLAAKPVSATLRISGLGQYEAHIDGRNVTQAVLTPGWTLYNKHVLYDTYNVLPLLQPGKNVLAVLLGNGMYNVLPDPGRYEKFHRSFGQPVLIAELTVTLANGTVQTISTDSSWRTAPGPITFSHVFGGEDYDARLDPSGWELAAFDDSAWSSAIAVKGPGGELISSKIPPVEAFETFAPVKTEHPSPTVAVYDLGQNFSGWPEIAVTGPAGATVRLIAGELLDASGHVTQHSVAASPDEPNAFTYTLRGGGTSANPETWHPRFSYWGFRYVQAETSSPGVTILKLDGRFLHDAAPRVGTFTSSDTLLNRIHGLIDRAMLSNMMSVLTDCPHREKLGWLEESHLLGTALMDNWNLASLYNEISLNMADSQQPSGLVPSIAPEYPVFGGAFRDSPEWGSAAVLDPWIAYQFSGDPAPLRQFYPSMQRYVAYLGGKAKDHLLDYGLGDWYDIGPGEPGQSKLTTKGLTASAIYFQDLTTLARIATITGHPEDATGYNAEAEAVKTAFNAKFFHPETGLYDRGSQTAQAMPLALGLVAKEHEETVLASLVAAIRAKQNHVTAGDVGFHYLVRALTDFGRSDVLYDMLSRTDPPSYGAQLAHGATSLTEAWDANPNDSQNHFMLGHAEEWFYRGLAGIRFDRSLASGESIQIRPAIPGDLTSAEASFRSTLGPIRVAWKRTGDTLTLNVAVPAEATIWVPKGWERDRTIDKIDGKDFENGTAYRRVKAGSYRLTLHRVAG